MKVIAFVGSPRAGGNTELVTRDVLTVLEREGIETEMVRLADHHLEPCTGCLQCEAGETCSIDDDGLSLYFKAKEADGLLLATPVYFSSANASMKIFMDRVGFIAYNNDRAFRRKVGGPLTVAGRNGGNYTNSQLLLWFMIEGMIVPGATDWNCAYGNAIGEIWNDKDGVANIRVFAENYAWLIKKLAS